MEATICVFVPPFLVCCCRRSLGWPWRSVENCRPCLWSSPAVRSSPEAWFYCGEPICTRKWLRTSQSPEVVTAGNQPDPRSPHKQLRTDLPSWNQCTKRVLSTPQSHNACFVSSLHRPHRWHSESDTIFLYSKFSFVGKENASPKKMLYLPWHFKLPDSRP